MRETSKTYLRFIVHQTDPDSGIPYGLFTIAYKVKKELILSEYEYEWLTQLLKWFEESLQIPDRFNRSSSKGNYRRNTRGVSWFKANATEHITKMREIAHILSEHGYFINEITTLKPGYIIFEDEFQIVAEPFSETPTI